MIEAIEEWASEYTKRHTDGLVAPQVSIGAVEGGMWADGRRDRGGLSPARRRAPLPAEHPPPGVRREVRAMLADLSHRRPELDIEVDMRVAIPGTSTDPGASGPSPRTARAWERQAGRAHEPVAGMSGATDANILRGRGVPTARVGMPKAADVPGGLDFTLGMNTVDVAGDGPPHPPSGPRRPRPLHIGGSHMSKVVPGGRREPQHPHEHALGPGRAHRPGGGVPRCAVTTRATRSARPRPDVALIVGSNHFRGFWLDLLPAFTFGVGGVRGGRGGGNPEGTPTGRRRARALGLWQRHGRRLRPRIQREAADRPRALTRDPVPARRRGRADRAGRRERVRPRRSPRSAAARGSGARSARRSRPTAPTSGWW